MAWELLIAALEITMKFISPNIYIKTSNHFQSEYSSYKNPDDTYDLTKHVLWQSYDNIKIITILSYYPALVLSNVTQTLDFFFYVHVILGHKYGLTPSHKNKIHTAFEHYNSMVAVILEN